MRSIQVEPGKLESTANNINNAILDYDHGVKGIYETVERMSGFWLGKDNVAFVNQINTFKEDLKQIQIIMHEYTDFLENTARAYRQTQDELANMAGRLKV